MKLKIPGKKHGKSRIPNFCYIKVIVFDFSYRPVAAVGTEQVRYHEKSVKNIKKSFSPSGSYVTIFLHYRVATKMALEILGYTCAGFDYDGW